MLGEPSRVAADGVLAPVPHCRDLVNGAAVAFVALMLWLGSCRAQVPHR